MGESGRKTRSDNGRMFLIAVGDRVAKLAWFSLSGSEDVRIDWHTPSIAKLSGSKLPRHNSQIEAVCADGFVFIEPEIDVVATREPPPGEGAISKFGINPMH